MVYLPLFIQGFQYIQKVVIAGFLNHQQYGDLGISKISPESVQEMSFGAKHFETSCSKNWKSIKLPMKSWDRIKLNLLAVDVRLPTNGKTDNVINSRQLGYEDDSMQNWWTPTCLLLARWPLSRMSMVMPFRRELYEMSIGELLGGHLGTKIQGKAKHYFFLIIWWLRTTKPLYQTKVLHPFWTTFSE